jgi:hypothetical protein
VADAKATVIVALDRSGVIRRLSFGAAGLEQQTLGNWTERIDSAGPATYAIFLADLDNNGAVDMVVSGGGRSRVWLGDEKNTLRPLASADAPLQDVSVFGVIDLNGDGQLDLVGTSGGSRWCSLGAARRAITGLSCVRVRSRRPATSESTRSAWAARSKSDPGC